MKTPRHTRATELLSVGVKPVKAARQPGHDKETSLKTYADYMPDYDEGSDDLLESAFAALWLTVSRNANFAVLQKLGY